MASVAGFRRIGDLPAHERAEAALAAEDGPGYAVESCGGDPAADRWTIILWSATADLSACAYAYSEEGIYDGVGRWRRRKVHHYLAGHAADRVRARVQAAHFCALVRQLARAYAKARGGSAHIRRSFEHGCGDRLVVRLRLAAASQRGSSREGFSPGDEAARTAQLRSAGLVPRSCPPPPDRSDDDRAAARAGKAAADNISLVLRTGSAHAPVARGEPQMSMF